MPPEVNELVPDSGLIDPPEPFSPDYFVEEYVPKSGMSRGRRRLVVFLALVVLLLALAAAWRWIPLHSLLAPERISEYLASISSPEWRAAIAISGFVVASLAMVPLTLLAVIGGIVFEGWKAFEGLVNNGLVQAPFSSYPTWFAPVLALDRIFVRSPAVATRTWRHDSPTARVASDHFPVAADLKIRKPDCWPR